MVTTKIDGVKLKEAIDQFGSLHKALANLESRKKALEKEVIKRKKENHQLMLGKNKLVSGIEDLKKQFGAEKKKLESVAANVGKWERQYNLFQGFLAMLVGSPSAGTSLKSLISLLEELDKSGWVMTKTLDDLRGYFVRTIMGDYLKCYHCKVCGAKFVVNKEPHYKSIGNYNECPSCHTYFGVEPDDTFLKAMISDAQFDDILRIRDIQKENDTLKPLEAFLSVACEICGKPVTEWNEHNVKIAVEKYGWGHTKCWDSDIGQLRLLAKFSNKIQGKQ